MRCSRGRATGVGRHRDRGLRMECPEVIDDSGNIWTASSRAKEVAAIDHHLAGCPHCLPTLPLRPRLPHAGRPSLNHPCPVPAGLRSGRARPSLEPVDPSPTGAVPPERAVGVVANPVRTIVRQSLQLAAKFEQGGPTSSLPGAIRFFISHCPYVTYRACTKAGLSLALACAPPDIAAPTRIEADETSRRGGLSARPEDVRAGLPAAVPRTAAGGERPRGDRVAGRPRAPFDHAARPAHARHERGRVHPRAPRSYRLRRRMPVVLTTVEPDGSALLREAKELGVAAVVKKPWKPQELQAGRRRSSTFRPGDPWRHTFLVDRRLEAASPDVPSHLLPRRARREARCTTPPTAAKATRC